MIYYAVHLTLTRAASLKSLLVVMEARAIATAIHAGNVASFHSYIAGAIACASIAAKKYVVQPNYNEATLDAHTDPSHSHFF
ncbi:MAG: hypothetical protein A3F13_00225 [Gammaproteobacteria bacterium RIFCSPHIGHO2_12_FULL_40_19]|nr:MAG: hypothetical protein A3F13_00225 [Gammaproteobacteria bacterium RIFCSPHIGHO2_12_FULL_40_19]